VSEFQIAGVLISPSSNPISQDSNDHVDFVIIGPEKTNTVRVDLKILLELDHCASAG